MPINGLQAFYYEAVPIDELDYFDIPEQRTGGVKTGGMQPKAFAALVESIKQNGLTNPVLVEVDVNNKKVQLGNNRCVAMKTLGYDSIKAVVITKNGIKAPFPNAKPIPPQNFDATMRVVHPGDEKYITCPYVRNLRGSFRQEKEPAEWVTELLAVGAL
jgi:hypothetical protein